MITITGQFFLIKNCNGAGIFGTTSGVKIVLKFQDAEGRWTPEKQQMATDEIKERCYRVGFRGKPEIVFPAPQPQPKAKGGRTVFWYAPFAQIPDAS